MINTLQKIIGGHASQELFKNIVVKIIVNNMFFVWKLNGHLDLEVTASVSMGFMLFTPKQLCVQSEVTLQALKSFIGKIAMRQQCILKHIFSVLKSWSVLCLT